MRAFLEGAVPTAMGLASLLLLASTVLLGLTWIATRLLARASAATRFVLWVSALAGVALMAAGRLVLPSTPLATSAGWSRVLRLPAWTPTESASTMTATVDATDASVVRVQTTSSAASAGSAPPAAGIGLPNAAATPRMVAGAPTPRTIPWWALTIAALWLLGAIAVAARFASGALTVRRLVRAAPRNLDGTHWTLLQQLSEAMGVQRAVALRWVDAEQIPMTAGSVHPVILLPLAATRWPRERLQMVLQHELAHIARYDLALVTIAQVALVLCWWQPLAWYALRQMEREREQACDDLVLSAGVSAADYASELISVVRELRVPAPSAFAALGMARTTQIEARVRAVLNPVVMRRRASRMVVATAGIAVCAMLPLGRVVPVARAAHTTTSRSYSISRTSETPTTSRASAVSAGGNEWLVIGSPCVPKVGETSVERTRDDSLDFYRRVDPRGCLRVMQRGRTTLTDDDALQSLEGPAAQLIIESSDGRTMRRLTAMANGATPSVSYLVDGHAVSASESEAWVPELLRRAARDAGIDVEHRVERLLRTGRVDDFLRDARLIRTEEVRQQYFQLALSNQLVRGDELTSLINAVQTYATTQTDRDVVRQLETAIAAARAR